MNTPVIYLTNQMSKFSIPNVTEYTTSYDDFEEFQYIYFYMIYVTKHRVDSISCRWHFQHPKLLSSALKYIIFSLAERVSKAYNVYQERMW